MKEALMEKLRPLGYTMSHAIKLMLRRVVEGRLVFAPPPKKPE
jgi:hypothetical protein